MSVYNMSRRVNLPGNMAALLTGGGILLGLLAFAIGLGFGLSGMFTFVDVVSVKNVTLERYITFKMAYN